VFARASIPKVLLRLMAIFDPWVTRNTSRVHFRRARFPQGVDLELWRLPG
jgi:hypothetical protein